MNECKKLKRVDNDLLIVGILYNGYFLSVGECI